MIQRVHFHSQIPANCAKADIGVKECRVLEVAPDRLSALVEPVGPASTTEDERQGPAISHTTQLSV